MSELETNSIGTLNEKNVHAYLKNYYENDKNYQEVKVGSYIADIKRDNNIIEIQTKNLKYLVNKINYYINNGFKVKIVHPIMYRQTLIWKDCTDILVSKRISKNYKVIQDSFYEIDKLREFIINNKIEVELVLIDFDDLRYMDVDGNRSKRAKSNRQIKVNKIEEVITLKSKQDLIKFIPDSLVNREFTSKEFKKESHVHDKYYNNILKTLRELKVIDIVGTKNRAYIYSIKH